VVPRSRVTQEAESWPQPSKAVLDGSEAKAASLQASIMANSGRASHWENPYLERRSQPSVQTDFIEKIPRTILSENRLSDRGVAMGNCADVATSSCFHRKRVH
jgi:hypothetical protein